MEKQEPTNLISRHSKLGRRFAPLKSLKALVSLANFDVFGSLVAGLRKGEKWSMSNYHNINTAQEKIQRIVAGVLLLSWLVLGNGGVGVASEAHVLLQIHGDRITGVLNQVPLRLVLEQLQEKLAIEYVVPGEELNKAVSVNLGGEPVTKALSKILASWDYALQVDQQGKVHQIFVVAKNETIENEKKPVQTSESKMAAFPRKMTISEPIRRTPKTQVLQSGTEMTSKSEEDAMVSPMLIDSSEMLPPMVIQPPQGDPMSIQPSSNFMQVIPASGYPPMEIHPVSEEARREFMELHN